MHIACAFARGDCGRRRSPRNRLRARPSWPTRPIHLIVPFPAGSSSDIVARMVAQGLARSSARRWWWKTGPAPAAIIANEAVAHAAPDGYTLGLVNTSFTLLPSLMAKPTYDPIKGFAPVSMIGASPFILASYPGLSAHTVQEVIALAKAEPGKH